MKVTGRTGAGSRARTGASCVSFSDVDARLWEISENLHRAELSVGERADQIAEWVRLTEPARREVSAQVAPNPQGGRPEGGLSAAARERADQIAEWIRLTEPARQAAQVEPAVLSDGRRAGPQHAPSGARLWEISENLHRAELSVGERADQIAEWIRLTAAQSGSGASCAKNPQGPGRPEGGIRAAARP